MPDKGKIMSQIYYEKLSRLIQLNQELFVQKEIRAKEAVTALRMIGFSETMAAKRFREWSVKLNDLEPEAGKIKKQMLKEQASLEKYILRARLGKQKYREYIELRSEFKQSRSSRSETVNALMQFGYSRRFAEHTVDKWEVEQW